MRHSIEYITAIHSLLFVPALNDRFIANAHKRGADAVIFDLEDSIAPDRKTAAREAVAAAIATVRPHGMPLLVRVNHSSDRPELTEPDLQAAVAGGADAILLPKVDHLQQLQAADLLLARFERDAGRAPGATRVIALIESPIGLLNAPHIAASGGRLCGLGFGSEDYAALLGVAPEFDAMSFPAQQVALAARAYGLAAWGLPGSIAGFDDAEAFEQLVRKAKAFGFTGALGIHPKQIESINQAFRPTDAELTHARRVLAAYEEAVASGAGAVALDGKMIDVPVVERARRLLNMHA